MDKMLLSYIASLQGQNALIDRFFIVTASYSSYFFMIVFMLITGYITLFKGPGRRKPLLVAILILSFTLGANMLIRTVVGRERPFVTFGEFAPLIYHTASFSFPSNHAAVSFAVAWTGFLVSPLVGWLIAGIAVIVSFSRVYVGVHFPADILAGMLVSFIVFFLVSRIEKSVAGKTGYIN